jgi:hypothetical protein
MWPTVAHWLARGLPGPVLPEQETVGLEEVYLEK